MATAEVLAAPASRTPHSLPDDRLWTVEEVAYFLGVGVRTVWRWHSAKKLPAGRALPGRPVRWVPQTIKDWVARQPAANK